MRVDDFDRLTPSEFLAASKAYRDREDVRDRVCWERARLMTTILVQPHVQRRLTPHELIPFAWERKKTLTKEEQTERVKAARAAAEEARKRFGF